jgi:DNA polymerase-3 subunit gamma/tau
LKTLEEPPHYAIFILATTEKHKILPTILSRCQIFDFNRIKVDDMAAHLASIAGKESISYEPDGLHIIAQKADGGLRDALSMFDQIVSFSGGKVTYRSVIDNLNILDYDYYFNVTDSLLQEDTAKTLLFFDEILSRGFDGAHFIAGLSEHFRNLLVSKDQSTLKLLEVSEGIKSKYLQQSQTGSVSFLLSAMNIANQCDISYKLSKNQRLQVELALLKMCHLPAAFNMAVSPLTATSANDGSLKKKPDTPAVKPPSHENKINNDTSVLSDAPLTYNTAARPQPTQNSQAAVPVKEQAPAEKPKIFIPSPSSGSLSVKIPSLTDTAKTEEEIAEEEDPYLQGDAREDFTMDSFLRYWSDFAAKVKAEGKKNLVTIFTSNAPRMVKPYEFEVVVGNKVQENLFKEERPEMHNFLRSKLNNFTIEVNARVDEQEVVRKPYTAIEKFQHMAARNPQLNDLRNRFNLDFD